MILQALTDFYDRVSTTGEEVAKEGWERKEIPFVVVLDEQGGLVQIEDTREGSGKNRRAKAFLVPLGVKKTIAIAANLLWDASGYVFGIVSNKKLKGKDAESAEKLRARASAQKAAFIERIEKELGKNHRVQRVLQFLKNISESELAKQEHWPEICETDPVVSFRFAENAQKLVCNYEDVMALLKNDNVSEKNERCLITGEHDEIERLHKSIQGVWGAQSSGANIVSFNLSSFESYGKKQGFNASIGKSAAFAYTTAVNMLLAKDSRQRMQVGDASTVFWSAKKTKFESEFSFFFSEPPKDNPAEGTQKIKELFASFKNGVYVEDDKDTDFYILGLSPNAARISVRFWHHGKIAEFAGRIRQHFEDLKIIKPAHDPEFFSIWRLLVNIASQDKSENIPPNLAGEFMRSIMSGAPYPATVLQAALRRIHSDTGSRVKPVRAALIKAYLNRYHRIYDKNQKEISMALDINQPSIGYQLGRLFATLAKIQDEAQPGINATIRERFYGAACASPVTVFANLLKLMKHHLAKLPNKGRAINFERLVGEIMSHLSDFPAHLDLHEQGRFAIGYYHQWQDFFSKTDTKENSEKTLEAGAN
ncbi:MAG: type I-C CRISPR-associated protein Cas8c/Csd1 [Candidatus Rifleibacteriota bacterium]